MQLPARIWRAQFAVLENNARCRFCSKLLALRAGWCLPPRCRHRVFWLEQQSSQEDRGAAEDLEEWRLELAQLHMPGVMFGKAVVLLVVCMLVWQVLHLGHGHLSLLGRGCGQL